MSHFTVAVITDSTEKLKNMLAPYDENIEVEPYISRTKEEIIEEAKERQERFLKEVKAQGGTYTDDEWKRKYIEAKNDEELYKCGIYDDEKYDEQRKRINYI